jgi:hypothetical protein
LIDRVFVDADWDDTPGTIAKRIELAEKEQELNKREEALNKRELALQAKEQQLVALMADALAQTFNRPTAKQNGTTE